MVDKMDTCNSLFSILYLSTISRCGKKELRSETLVLHRSDLQYRGEECEEDTEHTEEALSTQVGIEIRDMRTENRR